MDGISTDSDNVDASGFRVTVMTSFRTVGLVLKTVGALIVVGGIILDSYSYRLSQ